eukprot:GDKK01075627.1.p1 GENE.GDKK01075627.1~~GDKK01075627.1.p1  ORF type:complete len:204 (-),score=20.02 GDKK01075627.1:179-757(-)
MSNLGQQSHSFENQQFLGKVGYNWHGSYPVFIADAKFEPNFRQFNTVEDVSLSNEDLHNKLMKNSEGLPEASFAVGHWRVRGWPLWSSSLVIGLTCAAVTTRFYNMRTIGATPWAAVQLPAAAVIYTNVSRYILREKSFTNDFERNQYFAYDEIKARRDEERVRKAIESKKFVEDPLTEYRVKAWQVARAGY